MTNGNLYWDSQGYPHADYPPPYIVVGWYLEQDIQSSMPHCDELLQLCEGALHGVKPVWEGVGNAHSLNFTANGVQIVNEFTDEIPPCELSIEEFKRVLLLWRELIESPPTAKLH